MGDSRPMTTPMITNWKKLHASESVGGFHFVLSVDRVIDVFGQYQARYLFCCQHS
jgi:hypothetical protein